LKFQALKCLIPSTSNISAFCRMWAMSRKTLKSTKGWSGIRNSFAGIAVEWQRTRLISASLRSFDFPLVEVTQDLITLSPSGLFCAEGGFFIDPWQPVSQAVITHGHGDHEVSGCQTYLSTPETAEILRLRLGPDASIQALPYGSPISLGGVVVSLHPAGHILGSSQVRVESRGKVWVVSGDYKREPDPTCAPFEPIRCHTFVTESTFGLPIFQWQDQAALFLEVNDWWRRSREKRKTSLVFVYALGKAQRVLAGLDVSIGPIFTHGAVERMNQCYRDLGVFLPLSRPVSEVQDKEELRGALVLAPPSANAPIWTRKFPSYSSAFVSGWMLIRGNRRRRSVDRGFPLSDHADWPGLLQTVSSTGAEDVRVTHGFVSELTRWLREKGLHAEEMAAR
jgi:putative mRNA 3-end processing factor